MNYRIRLARPIFTASVRSKVDNALEAGNLTNISGHSQVAKFERCLAHKVTQPVVTVSSGTAALHVACLIARARLPENGLIAVPSYTFAASAGAVIHAGLRPLLCDVDPISCNISADSLDWAMAHGAVGVLLVDQFGLMVDAESLAGIFDERAVILEDAACALGAKDKQGRLAGTIGQIGAYSFHPRKPLTSAEGGALTSPDPEVVNAAVRLRNHGTVGYRDSRTFAEAGLNYRMSEIHAILGLDQLESFDRRLARRRAIAQRFKDALQDRPRVTVAGQNADSAQHSYSSFVTIIEGIPASDVVSMLGQVGIESMRPIVPLHLTPAYRSFAATQLPVAEWLWEHAVVIPVHEALSDSDADGIIDVLRKISF